MDTTLGLAFEKVERANPAAGELLRCCAFLHPDEIPEEMLIAGASALGPALKTIAADELEWNRAIGDLRKYSLVKRDAEKKILNIHRLVQAVIKESMEEETVKQWAARTMLDIDVAFPHSVPETWSQCEFLLPHALLIAQYIEEYQTLSEEAGHLLHEMATYLRDRARYSEAEPLYQQALCIQEQHLGPEHLEVATSLNGLANLYSDQGKAGEAEMLYQRALHIWEQQLGLEHPQVAYPLNNLANLYMKQGKYTEAESLYQRALRIRELQGPEHPDTAETLHDYAAFQEMQGNLNAAKISYARTLGIRELVFGTHHPKTTETRERLISLLHTLGLYEEAARLETVHSEPLA